MANAMRGLDMRVPSERCVEILTLVEPEPPNLAVPAVIHQVREHPQSSLEVEVGGVRRLPAVPGVDEVEARGDVVCEGARATAGNNVRKGVGRLGGWMRLYQKCEQ